MFRRSFRGAWIRRVGLALLGAAASSCGSDSTTAPLVPAKIAIVPATNGQLGTVGAPLTAAVAVRISAEDGTVLGAVPITWTVIGSGGAVAKPSTETDATGTATTLWTLGTKAGVDSLRAALPNGTGVVITATANAGPASQLAIASGDAQSVAGGSATAPLVVHVTDANGNPIKSGVVTWSLVGGGTLSSTSTITAADGTASVILTTDATPGAVAVAAAAGQLTAVGFSITVH